MEVLVVDLVCMCDLNTLRCLYRQHSTSCAWVKGLKIYKKLFSTKKKCLKSLESMHVDFWECKLQWWWLEVCLTNSLWDKVCISINNENLAKIILILGLSSYPPPTPSLCPPQKKFDPYSKNVLDLPIRKEYNWWRKVDHVVVIFLRCSLLNNIAKHFESSPMMSSFQDNAYI